MTQGIDASKEQYDNISVKLEYLMLISTVSFISIQTGKLNYCFSSTKFLIPIWAGNHFSLFTVKGNAFPIVV